MSDVDIYIVSYKHNDVRHCSSCFDLSLERRHSPHTGNKLARIWNVFVFYTIQLVFLFCCFVYSTLGCIASCTPITVCPRLSRHPQSFQNIFLSHNH